MSFLGAVISQTYSPEIDTFVYEPIFHEYNNVYKEAMSYKTPHISP